MNTLSMVSMALLVGAVLLCAVRINKADKTTDPMVSLLTACGLFAAIVGRMS